MSTPVINAIAEVNDTSLDGLFTAVANNETARESLSQSDRNIDAVASNVAASEALGQSGEAVRLAVTRREGRDPANYPTLDDVAADQSLMADIAARQESSRLVMRCQEAAASCASSQPAMLEIGKSSASLGEAKDTQIAMSEFSQNDFAVRCIMCGVSGLDPTTYADAAAFAADNAAITTVSEDQETISAIASCEGAMNAIAEDRSALTTIAASQTATDEVYENTVSINALNNSSLVETTVYEGGECAGAAHNYRNDRVVLLSHNSAQFGAVLANTSEFGRSAGDQPQTANQVAQNTNVNDGRNAANAQITFIDV